MKIEDTGSWVSEPLGFLKLSEAFRGGTDITLSHRTHTGKSRNFKWVPEDDYFFVLEMGGVVPRRHFFPFGKTTMFIDTNSIGRRALSEVKTLYDVHNIRISPALIGIEGSQGRNQTTEEYRKNVEKVHQKLKSIEFQNGKVLEPRQLDETREILINSFTDPGKEASFLRQVMELLETNSLSNNSKDDLLDGILECADQAKIERGELAVTAALQIVFAPANEDYNIAGNSFFDAGRRVLKPKKSPSTKEVYNVLNDLRLLKILAAPSADLQNCCLLTNDKGLALLWAGLNVYCSRKPDGRIAMATNFKLKEDGAPEMFPHFTLEQHERFSSKV